MKTGICRIVWIGVWLASLCVAAPAMDEFADLQRQIAGCQHWDLARLRNETLRPEALIGPADRTPVAIVLRRTQALLADLSRMPNGSRLEPEASALRGLAAEIKTMENRDSSTEADQRGLFNRLVAVRRRIAFKNPCLDFDSVLFLKHNKQARGCRHMVDQYLGFNAEKAGGIYLLARAFTDAPTLTSVLSEATVENGRLKGRKLEGQGAFIGLDLDYDAQTLLFAFTEAEFGVPANAPFSDQYCSLSDMKRVDKGAEQYYFRPESTYHVFRVGVDGTELTQLTDGRWNDYDPCFLPNGRIAFISERAGGQVRCGMRPLPSATLHAMMADGSDIIPLSWHETQEWQPSVDNQGLLVYTRWDYVDRDSDAAHHLWTCFPDGRDPRSPHGNYPDRREMRPWMEMSIRAIPGSPRYVATAAPHHGEAYGTLVLIDPRSADDRATRQLRRLTPEVPFPESESAPGVPHAKGTHAPLAEVYGTPWPLSENYYLCVYDTGQRQYALCLLDAFGNREILYQDPAFACLDPIPLRARPRPPVVSTRTLQAQADRSPAANLAFGTVAIMNVYDSQPSLPPNVRVREVRVVNLFPKDNPFQDEPNVGYPQAVCRGVLGTAPVEADGSAHFQVPAGAPVYFQLLDEEGLAVQTMRSDTYLHPGETLVCAGCHEPRQHAPVSKSQSRTPLALCRPPSPLEPEAAGAYPLTFARLVQPVLEAQCVRCHDGQHQSPGLRGDHFGAFGWSEGYAGLRPFAWGRSGGNGMALQERQYSLPLQEGARVSRLYRLLAKGHHDVSLSSIEKRRLTLWLDCNSSFYGAYTEPERQARGAVIRPVWGLPKWIAFNRLAYPGRVSSQTIGWAKQDFRLAP